jgi:hypothetical protein
MADSMAERKECLWVQMTESNSGEKTAGKKVGPTVQMKAGWTVEKRVKYWVGWLENK